MVLQLPHTLDNPKVLELPGNLELPNTLDNPKVLELPSGFSLESLYQIGDQSIWFLAWILKQERFWPDLTRKVLETPFTAERKYWSNCLIEHLIVKKNYKKHCVHRAWYMNGQPSWEQHWKNGRQHGILHRWWPWRSLLI